jgi:hypothetical protein
MLKDPEKVLSNQFRWKNKHTKRRNWVLRFVKSRGMIGVYWWHKPDGKPPIYDQHGKAYHGVPVGKYPDKPFICPVYAEKEL